MDRIEETRRALRRGRGGAGQGDRRVVDDFGPDFDEEGNPLEEGESDRIKSEEERQAPGPHRRSDEDAPTTTEDERRATTEEAGARPPEPMATQQGSQEPDRVREERSEDHARDGDGRRGAAAPRRGADRPPAPLRAGAAQDDPPGRRGGRGRGAQPARCSRSTRTRRTSASCWSPATAAWPGRSTRRSSARASSSSASSSGEGKTGRVLGRRPPRRLDACASAARSCAASTPASPTAPPSPTRARSPTS